jgi:hypothetical protein
MRLPYTASVLLALLSAVALAPHHVAAHGSLLVPRARNWLTNSQWTGVAPWWTYPRDAVGSPGSARIGATGINGVENFGNGAGGTLPSGDIPLAGPGAHLHADTTLTDSVHCRPVDMHALPPPSQRIVCTPCTGLDK